MTAAAPVEPVLSRDLPQDASPGQPPQPPRAAPAARALAVLEVSERGRHLAQAVPIMHWPCTLGRAVHADAVLTDPALAAEHLRLGVDEAGRVHVRVLDRVNGVWLGRRHMRGGQSFIWEPGAALAVGRTQLMLRLASAEPPPPQPWRPASRRGLAVTVLAVAALLGWVAVETLLRMNTAGNVAGRILSESLGVFLPLLAWVLLWMMASKLFAGFAMFGRHLRIAALGLLAFGGIGAALHAGAFAFSWPALARFDRSLAYAVLAATVWRHLCAATPLSRRLLAGGMACLLLAALGLQLGLQWQSHKRLGQGTLYLSHLYPPSWRLAPAQPLDDFLTGAQALRPALAGRVTEQDEHEDSELDE